MIVIDASSALGASMGQRGFAAFRREPLVAPPLLWSEVRSALHEAAWRGDIPGDRAREVLRRFEDVPIQMKTSTRLAERAWDIADRLGWAKTYDAEYLALAELLGCPIATLDGGMVDAAPRLRIVRFGP